MENVKSKMAKKHVIFLEKLKSLVRGKVEIFTVPFASRKRNKCKSNCKICISYKSGVRQLWLLEKFIEKEFKKNDFILVSIHEWWTFFESNPANISRKYQELLINAKLLKQKKL